MSRPPGSWCSPPTTPTPTCFPPSRRAPSATCSRTPPREELFRAVRAAARGETVLAPSVAALLLTRIRPQRPLTEGQLSAREREVLTLVAEGRTNREAAALLYISEATVKTHLLHIYAKLEVTDRASAVAAAYRRGVLDG